MSFTRTIIGKKGTDPLYGSTKTANTANTATNPELLRDGAIGVYGLQGTDVTTAANSGKWVLITDTATGAGITSKSEFTGKLIKICQGDSSRVSGFIESGLIDLSSGFSIDAVKSAAYTKQATWIGYNPSSLTGYLNFSSLPSVGDEIGIKSYRKLEGAYDQEVHEWSTTLNEDESIFDCLSKLVKLFNDSTYGGTKFTASVVCNAADGANATQTITIVTGSVTGTLALADAAYAIGAYIRFGTSIYKIIAKPTTTTVTFDRPVEEAGATVAAASVDFPTVTEFPTSGYSQFGIKIANNLDLESYQFSLLGVLENATIEYYTPTQRGSGLGSEILKIEKQGLPYRGNPHTGTHEFLISGPNGSQIPKVTVNEDGFYDIYIVKHGSYMNEKDYINPQNVSTQTLIVAFEVPSLGTGNGNTSTHNQSDFEDIATALYAATPQIAV